MKTFETPSVEVQKFNTVDILTASVTETTEEVPPPLSGINVGLCI